MSVTVTLPCKPYVAKYILAKYSKDQKTVSFPRSSHFKYIFLSCLTKKHCPPVKNKLHNTTIEIAVRSNHIHTLGMYLLPAKQYLLNSVIEEVIKNEIFYLVTLYRSQNITWKNAIYKTQSQMGFTEDTYSYHAIEEAYRKKLKTISITSVGKTTAA